MKINPLIIGDLKARLPIIQGGMGVGVSRSGLASAVARAGGIGIIAGVQIGYDEDGFEAKPLETNLKALCKHIKIAKENSNGGIIGLNMMVALKHYDEYIKAAIKSGIDLIISGAGLPIKLPELIKGAAVKIAPIVSSGRAASVILKMWDKRYETTADMVVIEGPKAGGHLGFSKEEVESDIKLEDILKDVAKQIKPYEDKYNKNIPIVVAGGIYDGFDIARFLKLGASGVQMATRFVATEECDAHVNFKMAYVNSRKEDIQIVESPVGMPGRAIANDFVNKTKGGRVKVSKCYNCLTPCNPLDTPYCISTALMNSAKGNVDEGLVFCGENAYRIKEIVPVKDLMEELERDILAAE